MMCQNEDSVAISPVLSELKAVFNSKVIYNSEVCPCSFLSGILLQECYSMLAF